jgi:hypothetical protein
VGQGTGLAGCDAAYSLSRRHGRRTRRWDKAVESPFRDHMLGTDKRSSQCGFRPSPSQPPRYGPAYFGEKHQARRFWKGMAPPTCAPLGDFSVRLPAALWEQGLSNPRGVRACGLVLTSEEGLMTLPSGNHTSSGRAHYSAQTPAIRIPPLVSCLTDQSANGQGERVCQAQRRCVL